MDYKTLYEFLYAKKAYNTGDEVHPVIITNYDNVISLLSDSSEKTHIDIGCSFGKTCKHFKEKGFNTVGIDASETACRITNEKYGILTHNTSITDMSIFKDNSFSLVTSTDVIEHISPEEMRAAISEMCRICSDIIYVRVAKIPEYHKTDLSGCPISGLTELHISLNSTEFYTNMFSEFGFETVSIPLDISNFCDIILRKKKD